MVIHMKYWKFGKRCKKTNRLNTLEIQVLWFFDYQILNDMDNMLSSIEDRVLTYETKLNDKL